MPLDPRASGERGPVEPFGERLRAAVRARRSCLVVGLDPVLERLPRAVFQEVPLPRPGEPGFTARAAACFGRFLEGVVEAVADTVAAVKPNVAFFERLGPVGLDCFCRVCRVAHDAGLLVIADVKRGDIGSTARAYADAFLGDLADTPGPYVDAVTLNPYLGTDSMEPFLALARQRGKGIFVLVRTSNPSAADLQDLAVGGEPLYLRVARLVATWGADLRGPSGFSSVGAVVGATAPSEAGEVRKALPWAPFLVPGFGAQGAGAQQLRACFLPGGEGSVVNSSRSILYAHEESDRPWREAVREAACKARDAIEAIRQSV